MDDLIEILNTFSANQIIIYTIMLAMAIMGVEKVGTEILSKLNLYHKKKSNEETICERIARLEKHDNYQYKEITKMSENMSQGFNEIKEIMKENKEVTDQVTQATCRSTLYRLHKEFMEQGYVTREEIKTFIEIGKVYEQANGNDIYHDKLHPEVMKLPIREVE